MGLDCCCAECSALSFNEGVRGFITGAGLCLAVVFYFVYELKGLARADEITWLLVV